MTALAASAAAALARFPRERTWLLPALQAVQEIVGHLPDWALVDVGRHLRVPASEVYGVATHYPEFRLSPRGAHHVRVCTGVSCWLAGGRALLDAICQRHAVEPGDMGADRSLTIETADCFFECSVAPLVEVDGAYRGRVPQAEDPSRSLAHVPQAEDPSRSIAHVPQAEDPSRSLAHVPQPGDPSRSLAHVPQPGDPSGSPAHVPQPGDPSGSPAHTAQAEAPSQSLAHVPPAEARPRSEVARGGPSAEAILDGLVGAAAERRRGRPRLRLVVHAGTCGRAVGADMLAPALRQAVKTRGVEAEVIEGACPGACYAAPSVEVQMEGRSRFLIEGLHPDAVPALIEGLHPDAVPALIEGLHPDAVPAIERLTTDDRRFSDAGLSGVVWDDAPWRGLVPAREHPFWKTQTRVLMARCGLVDPEDLDDALLHGAYRALARALDRPAIELIESVKASGLQGRGGAFFPTGLKWEACRRAGGDTKYVVVNGEEGEPGIFKDRHLMEGDPHQLIEGALLAAYAAGATRVIVYVHGEADLSAARLTRAVAQAEAAGIIGERMLGTGTRCRVELRRGAGGFVLGEETALLESIEGRRAQPRTRPPFPVESGLWGKPTVINNVETLSAIPSIVGAGAAWFAALGTPKAPGTKVFGLSGPIGRPGVIEVRNGVTLRILLEEIGGGIADGRAWQGAVVGGPSGAIVPAALFDVPMEPRERVSPGTGGIVAVPAGASVTEIVKTLLRFNAGESCGKCTPCREGTPRLLAMIDEVSNAADRDAWRSGVETLAEAVQLASLCGLGQAAPLALQRALETFPGAFRGRA